VTVPTGLDQDPWRDLAPRVLVRLLREHGDGNFGRCEDAVQEALAEAHQQWASAPPDDPHAWLVTTARRRYIDGVRSDSRRRQRERRYTELGDRLTDHAAPSYDDTLRLIELCCHPALSRPGQVALTLRAVGGLTTTQIANAYALPEATIAQRIVRAKRRLRQVGATFPAPAGAGERVPAVLTVLYLMFTEAHHTSSGAPPTDTALADEAIRLARLVLAGAPDHKEAAGLLALMLLTHARQPARTGMTAEVIPLDEQDRNLWDPDLIREGLALLDRAVPGAAPGPYLIQACIAGLHAQAASTESTDWHEIRVLYRLLQRQSPRNPTIAVNAAVAEAMVAGPAAGLAALEAITPRPSRAHSVAAHLHERMGDVDAALDHYRAAIKHTSSLAERRYLARRAAALRSSSAALGR